MSVPSKTCFPFKCFSSFSRLSKTGVRLARWSLVREERERHRLLVTRAHDTREYHALLLVSMQI